MWLPQGRNPIFIWPDRSDACKKKIPKRAPSSFPPFAVASVAAAGDHLPLCRAADVHAHGSVRRRGRGGSSGQVHGARIAQFAGCSPACCEECGMRRRAARSAARAGWRAGAARWRRTRTAAAQAGARAKEAAPRAGCREALAACAGARAKARAAAAGAGLGRRRRGLV